MAGLLGRGQHGGGLLGGMSRGLLDMFGDRGRQLAGYRSPLDPVPMFQQAHQAMPWGGNDPSAIGIDTQAGTIDPSVMVPFGVNVAGMVEAGGLGATAVRGPMKDALGVMPVPAAKASPVATAASVWPEYEPTTGVRSSSAAPKRVLPMDYAARMERSTQMNFDPKTFYHATGGDFDEFDLKAAHSNASFGEKKQKAVFLTSDPQVAQDFISPYWFSRDGATPERAYITGGNIMPLRVRDLDQFDIWETFGRTYDPEFVRNAIKEARKDGKKGVIFEHMRDFGIGTVGMPKPSHVVAVFDPALIRSTAAAFDPAKAKSRNILAANPAPAAGIGAATQSEQPTYRTGGRF